MHKGVVACFQVGVQISGKMQMAIDGVQQTSEQRNSLARELP
jgi:hypothetical protein